jgi:predicted GIY-YIG superfamily endonuclease
VRSHADKTPTRSSDRNSPFPRSSRLAGSNREGAGSQRAARHPAKAGGGIRARDEENKADEGLTGARASVYRHYDKEGALLYVGVSLSAIQRLGQHRSKSEWFCAITTVTIQRFASRQAALKAEKKAIRTENPLHNFSAPKGRRYVLRVTVSEAEKAALAKAASAAGIPLSIYVRAAALEKAQARDG